MGTPEKAISFLTDLTSWHSKNFRPDTTNNFDSNALAGMIITDVSPGRMLCELAVTPRVQNRFGSLHGGCIATLVDDVSSGAVVSVSPHGGVSISMSMNYLSPTPGSQDCEIDAKVVKAGRTLAFADVEIRNKKTGQVTARGTHIKFIPQVTVTSSGSAPVPKPVGTPKHANTVEAAESFISNMCSDALEGFDPESTQNFDTTALYGLKDITATPGKVVCTLPVHKRVQNNYLTLHGGCTATLVDVIGSAAIVSVAEHSGVSLQISVDYLSELPGGEDCEITATVAKIGRSTATAIVELRNKRTGRLTARGTHVKFLGTALPEVRSKL